MFSRTVSVKLNKSLKATESLQLKVTKFSEFKTSFCCDEKLYFSGFWWKLHSPLERHCLSAYLVFCWPPPKQNLSFFLAQPDANLAECMTPSDSKNIPSILCLFCKIDFLPHYVKNTSAPRFNECTLRIVRPFKDNSHGAKGVNLDRLLAIESRKALHRVSLSFAIE